MVSRKGDVDYMYIIYPSDMGSESMHIYNRCISTTNPRVTAQIYENIIHNITINSYYFIYPREAIVYSVMIAHTIHMFCLPCCFTVYNNIDSCLDFPEAVCF